jgi:hypothetical protein
VPDATDLAVLANLHSALIAIGNKFANRELTDTDRARLETAIESLAEARRVVIRCTATDPLQPLRLALAVERARRAVLLAQAAVVGPVSRSGRIGALVRDLAFAARRLRVVATARLSVLLLPLRRSTPALATGREPAWGGHNEHPPDKGVRSRPRRACAPPITPLQGVERRRRLDIAA